MAETILIVDDDPALRELLGEALAHRGYRVLTAADGLEGLRLARAERPALMVCDVVMPGLNGWELCRQVREDPALAETPFLFLSAISEGAARAHGLELGADDYVPKPVNLRELELRILRTLRRLTPGREAPLSGELTRLPLADLLQLLAAHRQTGLLHLRTPTSEAQITLRDGQPLAAVFGLLGGREALYALLALEAGRFRFDAVEVYAEDEIRMEVQELLLEAALHQDDAGRDSPGPHGGKEAPED